MSVLGITTETATEMHFKIAIWLSDQVGVHYTINLEETGSIF